MRLRARQGESEQVKLLIVDDLAVNRKLLRAQLEAKGHGVTEAANGVEAIALLKWETIDGIVSDILMPEMDGFRFCMELRRTPEHVALPFVLYTSTYNSPQDRKLAETVGADAYIVKPSPIEEVLGALREAVSDNRSRRVSREPEKEDAYVLKQYNAALVRKLEERNIELERLNRVFDVLSSISSLLLRFRNRQELFEEACRIATEHGQFGIAWIGTYNTETMEVTPAAWSGIDMEPVDSRLSLVGNGTDIAPGTMARLFIEHLPVVYNDIGANSHAGGSRREEALRRGYRSLIVLPLVVDSKVVASFSLFAREVGFFNEDEIRLLTQLAGDISFALQYIAKEEAATYLAYYDPLTGLPNRTLFLEHLSHALVSARNSPGHLVLALGDIKRFRHINDMLGRPAADEILTKLSARLLQLFRNPENIARISGNCFATFLPGITDLSEVALRIEHLMKDAIDRPITVADQEINLAFSVGVAVHPHDGLNAETLFRNAEAALAKAKAEGERYVFYAPEMNSRVAETLALETKLRRALEADHFVLFYQPKVAVATGRLTGFEALIRWQDPELGLVPPAKFIPLMEETGLILDVGKWALGRAVADYRAWSAAGLQPPRIAVNVSSKQLRQKNFIDMIVNAVDNFGELDVALDLEVTESVLIEDIQEAIKKLQVVRGLGVEISIDDFGTGYSSLGYIAKLPINALKIDRSFVIEMANNEYCRNIVKMIVSLAHTLNLKVIAEGVDDEEHVRILRELRCDEMQGFLISRPIPPAEIEVLLRQVATRTNRALY